MPAQSIPIAKSATSAPESAARPPAAEVHPPTTADDRTAHILGLLQDGFLTDSTRFRQLELDLTATIHRGRNFGAGDNGPAEEDRILPKCWDKVEGILHRIHLLVTEMDEAFRSDDHERLSGALSSWETIQAEDLLLVDALHDLRTQALVLSPTSRQDWNMLAETLDAHVETIRSCSQAFRAKLEMLKEHTKDEVDLLVHDLIAQLLGRTATQDERDASYQEEYDKAVIELNKEQHQPEGFRDTIKSMFMWMESPEERISKNRSLRIDPT